MSIFGGFLYLGQLIMLLPIFIIVVLVVYALLLAIKALRIYINKNS